MRTIILLTGGIASGKTFASNFLENLGATVIDTDLISRELTNSKKIISTQALEEIRDLFGDGVFAEDASLNRRVLRDLIFNNSDAKIALESILHPKIHNIVLERLQKEVGKYYVLVVPLIHPESIYLKLVSRVLSIELYECLQVSRLMRRDNINETLARAIIQSQISRLDRRKLANDVIINIARNNTERRLKELHQIFIKGII